MKIKYYGRYVDDMVFVHHDKMFLESLIPQLRNKLAEIGLILHPNKIILKSVSDGLPFLGQIIKPYRKYIANRSKNNFYEAITKVNQQLLNSDGSNLTELQKIRATINSYLGTLTNAKTYRLRKKIMDRLHQKFHTCFEIKKEIRKIQFRKLN